MNNNNIYKFIGNVPESEILFNNVLQRRGRGLVNIIDDLFHKGKIDCFKREELKINIDCILYTIYCFLKREQEPDLEQIVSFLNEEENALEFKNFLSENNLRIIFL
jgi:hypothetical protein